MICPTTQMQCLSCDASCEMTAEERQALAPLYAQRPASAAEVARSRFRILNEDDANWWIGDPISGELIELIPDGVDADDFLARFVAAQRAH